MAVTHKLYGPFLKNLANGNIGNIGSTAADIPISVRIMTSAHSFTVANEYWATVSANQASSASTGSTDYRAGGKLITGTALSYSTRVTTLTATSETVFSTGGDIKGFFAVLAASSYLVSCIDFDGEEASVDGEFKITWADKKILTMTVSA